MRIDPVHKRVVPVVAGLQKPDDALPLAEALLAGGLNVMEITFRTAAAEPAVKLIAQRMPQMILGAGTLLTVELVQRAKDAGAQFGVAPGLNLKVVEAAQKLDFPFVPGVMTPSEVESALNAGCALQKFFPANIAGGVGMLKALAGPYGHTGVKFIVLGGVTPATMPEFLALPIVAAIGGSWLVESSLIAKGDWAGITARTKEALEIAGHGVSP
jgi:2-dehydro-3-deoxyphosphogluconate aldolase/(4S)-4-hydroxy-2-oxoglutarate aldolase